MFSLFSYTSQSHYKFKLILKNSIAESYAIVCRKTATRYADLRTYVYRIGAHSCRLNSVLHTDSTAVWAVGATIFGRSLLSAHKVSAETGTPIHYC